MPIRKYSKTTTDDSFLRTIERQIDPADALNSVTHGSLDIRAIDFTDVSTNAVEDIDKAMASEGYAPLASEGIVLSGSHHWGNFTTANEPSSNVAAEGDTGYNLDLDAEVIYNGVAWHISSGHTSFPFGGFGRLENYILHSEDMGNAVWVDAFGNTTITANNATAPNGELSADTVDFTSTGLGLRQSNLGTSISTLYTLSFWARLASGNGNVGFDLGDGTSVIITVGSTLRRYSFDLTSGTGSDFLDITKFAFVGAIEFWGWSITLGSTDQPYVKTTDTALINIEIGTVINETLRVKDNIFLNGNPVSPQGPTVFDIFSNDDWPDAITAPDGELRVPLVLSGIYYIHKDVSIPKMLLPEGTDPLAFQLITFRGAQSVTNLFVDGDMTGHFWGRDCQGIRFFDLVFTDIGNAFTGFSTKLFNLVGLGGATALLFMERCAIFQFKQLGQLVDIGLVQIAAQDGFNDSGWTVRSTLGAALSGLVNSTLNTSSLNIPAFPDAKHPAYSFIGVMADFAVTHHGLNMGKAANSGFYFDQGLIGGAYALTAFSYGGPTTHGEFFRPDLVLSITAQANADESIVGFSDSPVNPGVDTQVNMGTIHDFIRGQIILIADEAAYDGLHEIVRVSSDQRRFDINVLFSTSGTATLKMVKHTVVANKFTRDETVVIAGTTSYNETSQVLRETDTTFHLPQAFIADDATGTATSTSLDETSNAIQVAVAGAQKDSVTSAEILMDTNLTETSIPLINALVLINSSQDFTSKVSERIFVTTDGEAIYRGRNPQTLAYDGNVTMSPANATKTLEASFFRQDATDNTVTFTNLTNLINETATALTDGDSITFNRNLGILPTELRDDIVYFVVNKLANSFQVSYISGGAAITFTDDGSGTNTYSTGERHGSEPFLPISSGDARNVVPQALARLDTDDSTFIVVSNKTDAVNIIVSKVYYRVKE